jgi:hypothetical protein
MKPELFKWSEVLYGFMVGIALFIADILFVKHLKYNIEIIKFGAGFITALSLILLAFNLFIIIKTFIKKTIK